MIGRGVTTFPIAYTADASYRKYFFDGEVRDFCDQDLALPKPHLRVSKCIFVGDIAVGKTCLINRFGYNVFTNNYKATIGVDFDVQNFNILNMPFNLQIWDTAGQERFRCIASTYYRGAHAAVIAFDMSNLASLSNVEKWFDEVNSSNTTYKPLMFLIGTKKELLCESAFNFVESEAIRTANKIGAEYWSVSAATGSMVEEFFTRVAVLTFQEMIHREINAARIEKPITYSNNKFIKLKKDKNCKKFWSFSCARF